PRSASASPGCISPRPAREPPRSIAGSTRSAGTPMAEPPAYRRVVTGLGAEGRSRVIIDGPIPRFNAMSAALAWRTEATPADNTGSADPVVPYSIDLLHT